MVWDRWAEALGVFRGLIRLDHGKSAWADDRDVVLG